MAIYIKFDGIQGTVEASSRAGGANFAMLDGSVKTISRSSGGPRVTVFDGSNHSGGSGGILVSKIELANTSFGAIDALAPNAVVQARALFETQSAMDKSHGVVFSISENGAHKLRHANNLRQISLAAHGQVSTVRLFINDQGNPSGVTITLENVRLSKSLFKSSLSRAGKAARIDFCKTN